MLVRNVQNDTILDHVPLILSLNKAGEPLGWITYQDCAFYKAKNKILWTLGEYEVILRGGINAVTGQQSKLTLETIVALDYDKSPSKYRRANPSLTNKTLFVRDRYLCAYCGSTYRYADLTRDHVQPVSKGGPDTWSNVVSSCKTCNQYKSDRTPEQADMKLLYVPYVPTYNEHLILQNRKILQDQMEFLMKGVSKHSRLHLH